MCHRDLCWVLYINDLNGCLKQLTTPRYNDGLVRAVFPRFADDTQFTMTAKTGADLKIGMNKNGDNRKVDASEQTAC